MSTPSGSGWMQLPSNVRARIRAAMFDRYGRVCHLQYRGTCTYHATEADHLLDARVHGHGLDNLRPACGPCNRRKGEPGDGGDPAALPGAWG